MANWVLSIFLTPITEPSSPTPIKISPPVLELRKEITVFSSYYMIKKDSNKL
jgi:hypothetical protein